MAPSIHPQGLAALRALATLGGPLIQDSSPEDFRAWNATRPRPDGPPVHEVRDLDAGGIPCRLYRPSAEEGIGLLVHIHGGAWVIGTLDSYDAVCRSLAVRSGAAVLSVDYRLAPEHPWPAAVEDSLCAVRWASENASSLGIDPDRIAVGGDSAGGNLAAIVAQQRPVPLRFQLLVYPATDMTRSLPSHTENARGPILDRHAMDWFIGHYIPDAAGHRHELASPLHAADALMTGLPPALVITAQYDPLRDEGEAYGSRMIEHGGTASVVRFNGMFHGFWAMQHLLDDADHAHDIAAAALRRALA